MAKSAGGKKLVIVESPTKAKTIRKFLGKDYVVESCMGHIRDLPQSAKDIPEKYKKQKWATLGVNVDEDFEPIYCVPYNKTKVVSELRKLSSDADEIILATDEDREGESISWHLLEVLKPKVPVKRMVFHEITKEAIQESLKNFRNIDDNLVHAQEARRILDRLVGYTISPLVWKKVAYGLSAGRVQSVAVCLICDKELQRIAFHAAEYWSLQAQVEKKGSPAFAAKLLSYQNKRIAMGKDFDPQTGKLLAEQKNPLLLLDKTLAEKIAKESLGAKWTVTEVEQTPVSRQPAPPFITSTLQQEANRKLGWGSRDTMRAAQQLYEQGYITYMRTDSTFLSQQALEAARKVIVKLYGKEYLPEKVRDFAAKKVKGAQEAHEAIRPAGTEMVPPEDTDLKGDQLKLYDLIWKRTVACQMKNAEQNQMSVKMAAGDAIFQANGTTIIFPGFLRAYVEGDDDPESSLEEREVHLPELKKAEAVNAKQVNPEPHETKPPARFTEATLVKILEKEGVGRPSTYAAIIGTIIDRGYARKAGNALVPTFTAMVVAKLLTQHLPQYVDVGFTSEMEKSLDDIAAGDLDSTAYLKKLYFGKLGLKQQVEDQEGLIDPEEARGIRFVKLKNMEVRVGRYGAYVTKLAKKAADELSVSLPDSLAPADITEEMVEKLLEQKEKGADAFCKDPKSGLPIYLLTGRYGPYVQLGDIDSEDAKPKRVSLPAGVTPEQVTPEMAIALLGLPKTLGTDPKSGKEIKAGIGRFGPYIVCDGDFRSIPKTESVFTFTFEQAVALLATEKKGRGSQKIIRELGVHPDNQEAITLMDGKYGPYVKCGKKNVSLPEGITPEKMELAKAVELLGAKMDKAPKKGARIKKTALKSKTKEVAPVAPATVAATKKIVKRAKKPEIKLHSR